MWNDLGQEERGTVRGKGEREAGRWQVEADARGTRGRWTDGRGIGQRLLGDEWKQREVVMGRWTRHGRGWGRQS